MRFVSLVPFFFVLCSCTSNDTSKQDLLNYIPKEASVIIKSGSWENLRNSISNNDMLKHLSSASTYKELVDKLEPLSHLNPDGEFLICLSKDSLDSLQYAVIAKYSNRLFKTDSIPNYIGEKLSYKNKTITKSTIDENVVYSSLKDSIFFASSSRPQVEAIFGKAEVDLDLEKIYNTVGADKTASVILNRANKPFVKSFFVNDSLPFISFTNYLAADVEISQHEILLNGITRATDSSKSLITVFKNTVPQENLMSKITPSNSDGFMSFTFDDFNVLKLNLARFNGQGSILTNTYLFDNIVEVGVIYEGDDKAIVLNSIDEVLTKDALIAEQNPIGTYRQVELYGFSGPGLFSEVFYPFVTFSNASKYCIMDNFFVFADSILGT